MSRLLLMRDNDRGKTSKRLTRTDDMSTSVGLMDGLLVLVYRHHSSSSSSTTYNLSRTTNNLQRLYNKFVIKTISKYKNKFYLSLLLRSYDQQYTIESSWYLGMVGSGGCVASQNSLVRPRKPAATRSTNSARPLSPRRSSIILEFCCANLSIHANTIHYVYITHSIT